MQDLTSILSISSVAGAFGGIVRWMAFRESFRELAYNTTSGALTAHYMTNPVLGITLSYSGVVLVDSISTMENMRAGTSFILGFIGTALLAFFTEVTSKYIRKKVVHSAGESTQRSGE